MEISAVDFDDSVPYPIDEPEFADWEKVGRTALIGFSLMACGAFIPAFFKKRRNFSHVLSNIPLPPEPVAEPGVERPILKFPRCDDIERPKVEEIFRISAGGTTAITNAPTLIQLGNEIDHIHPFAFLLAAPKEHVRTIFYRTGFFGDFLIGKVMGGVKKGMERESARNNLERYIPDFAAAFGKDPDRIRPLIRAHSWRSLVHYLFEIDIAHED